MTDTRWVAVQVHFPHETWETGRDGFRDAVAERSGQFLPDAERLPVVVVTAISPHEAATVAEAAVRAIEAIEADSLGAGIGRPVALNVQVLDREPSSASHRYGQQG